MSKEWQRMRTEVITSPSVLGGRWGTLYIGKEANNYIQNKSGTLALKDFEVRVQFDLLVLITL